MVKILFALMVAAALEQFGQVGRVGMTIYDLRHCRSRTCLKQIEKHSRDVLRVNWKPISVWPEEAKMFQ